MTVATGTPMAKWSGRLTRLHAEDDDFGQAGTMVREVLGDDERQRLVDNIVGHLLNAVSEPVLVRAFEYWRNVDKDLGDRVEGGVRAKQGEKDPKSEQQANPARRACRTRPDSRLASSSRHVPGARQSAPGTVAEPT